MEIPDSDEGNVGVTTSESPAEVAVVRIVSNLPAASREAGNEPQAASSDRARTHHEEMDCWTDEDGDDEDIDIDELEDDMAELEEELDHGAWDGVPGPPAGFPDYVHGALSVSNARPQSTRATIVLPRRFLFAKIACQ